MVLTISLQRLWGIYNTFNDWHGYGRVYDGKFFS